MALLSSPAVLERYRLRLVAAWKENFGAGARQWQSSPGGPRRLQLVPLQKDPWKALGYGQEGDGHERTETAARHRHAMRGNFLSSQMRGIFSYWPVAPRWGTFSWHASLCHVREGVAQGPRHQACQGDGGGYPMGPLGLVRKGCPWKRWCSLPRRGALHRLPTPGVGSYCSVNSPRDWESQSRELAMALCSELSKKGRHRCGKDLK